MKNHIKLIFYTNTSPIILLLKVLFGVLFLDIILVLTFSIIDFINLEQYVFIKGLSFEEHIVIIFLFIHVLLFLYLFLIWFFYYYKIYNDKIEYNTGIFFKKKKIFIIKKIDSISINQSFLGRFLGYGNIILFYNNKGFTLKYIPHPEEFIEFIEFFKGDINITK